MAFVITGGTGGIGQAVAAQLADSGRPVVTIGRSSHATIRADLSLLRETARAADEVRQHTDRVEALVLCAGVFAMRTEMTDEGLERGFALNYLSRFLLVRELLPVLGRGGRVVLVANAGKYRDTLDLDALEAPARGLRVSGRTQFANDLLAVELAARRPDLAASCVYPGRAATGVFRNARGVPAQLRLVLSGLQRLAADPARAAATPTWLALGGPTSGFYGPGKKRRRIPDRARRPDRRAELWATSERLLAERGFVGRGTADHGR